MDQLRGSPTDGFLDLSSQPIRSASLAVIASCIRGNRHLTSLRSSFPPLLSHSLLSPPFPSHPCAPLVPPPLPSYSMPSCSLPCHPSTYITSSLLPAPSLTLPSLPNSLPPLLPPPFRSFLPLSHTGGSLAVCLHHVSLAEIWWECAAWWRRCLRATSPTSSARPPPPNPFPHHSIPTTSPILHPAYQLPPPPHITSPPPPISPSLATPSLPSPILSHLSCDVASHFSPRHRHLPATLSSTPHSPPFPFLRAVSGILCLPRGGRTPPRCSS